MTIGVVIKSQDCVDAGAQALLEIAPEFQGIIARNTPLPLRLRGDGFEALLRAIVGQQISLASAASVWARLEAGDMITQQNIAQADADALRALGLSRPKAKYAKSLAEAEIDYPALWHQPNAQVMAQLTAIKGIGRWSAEIYLMFSLGRADVLPVGDIALQEAAKVLFDLPSRPTEAEFDRRAQKWAPWRAIAARALWAYYAELKNREGIAP